MPITNMLVPAPNVRHRVETQSAYNNYFEIEFDSYGNEVNRVVNIDPATPWAFMESCKNLYLSCEKFTGIHKLIEVCEPGNCTGPKDHHGFHTNSPGCTWYFFGGVWYYI